MTAKKVVKGSGKPEGPKLYTVEFTEEAKKNLSKLDVQTRTLIAAWISKNLYGCTNPREKGKALTGRLAQYWRYRVGKYRIITDIQDSKLIILVITVGKRDSIYSDKK